MNDSLANDSWDVVDLLAEIADVGRDPVRDRLRTVLERQPEFATVPVLPTGAGHDAGVLAAELPTAMLFVRNPTGVSHAPAETATEADCRAGATALATVLATLAGA